MKVFEIFEQWEVVYVDEQDNVLTEAAVRQFKKKRGTNKMEKKFRCTTGPKKGKIVAQMNSCSKRPDPKKRRQGRKVMRTKKAAIQRKSRISKKKAISKTLTKLNARLMSKSGKPKASNPTP